MCAARGCVWLCRGAGNTGPQRVRTVDFLLRRSALALLDHVPVDVEHGHLAGRGLALLPHALQNPKRDVTCTRPPVEHHRTQHAPPALRPPRPPQTYKSCVLAKHNFWPFRCVRNITPRFAKKSTHNSQGMLRTCTAGDVEVMNARSGVEHRYKFVLPEAVQAAAHDIVHDVILGRHARENLAHERLLLAARHGSEPCKRRTQAWCELHRGVQAGTRPTTWHLVWHCCHGIRLQALALPVAVPGRPCCMCTQKCHRRRARYVPLDQHRQRVALLSCPVGRRGWLRGVWLPCRQRKVPHRNLLCPPCSCCKLARSISQQPGPLRPRT